MQGRQRISVQTSLVILFLSLLNCCVVLWFVLWVAYYVKNVVLNFLVVILEIYEYTRTPFLVFYHIVGNAFSNLVHYCKERRLIQGFSFGNPSVEVTHL